MGKSSSDSSVSDMINNVQTLNTNVESDGTTLGSTLAFNSVNQSMAIAVQDAVDTMRNVQTINNTVVGAAAAMVLADESKILQAAAAMVLTELAAVAAVENLNLISEAATNILTTFEVS